jgi:hypothetical protein
VKDQDENSMDSISTFNVMTHRHERKRPVPHVVVVVVKSPPAPCKGGDRNHHSKPWWNVPSRYTCLGISLSNFVNSYPKGPFGSHSRFPLLRLKKRLHALLLLILSCRCTCAGKKIVSSFSRGLIASYGLIAAEEPSSNCRQTHTYPSCFRL